MVVPMEVVVLFMGVAALLMVALPMVVLALVVPPMVAPLRTVALHMAAEPLTAALQCPARVRMEEAS